MKRLTNFEDYLLDRIFEAASNKHTAIILSSRLFDLLNKIDHPIAYDMVDFNSSDTEGDKKFSDKSRGLRLSVHS